MTKKLLNLKHWQLLLLVFAPPMVLQTVVSGIDRNATNEKIMFAVSIVLMIYFFYLFFGGMYSLGKGLHERLPQTVRMSLLNFKLALAIPLTCACILLFTGILATVSPKPSINLPRELLLIITPVILVCISCLIFCLGFIIKALKSVELKREVPFVEYVGEFFLAWFWFIGIWIIQPRVNRIFDPALQHNEDILDDRFLEKI